LASIRPAILLRMAALAAEEVLPQASLAACAASRARSMSAASERGISQNALPVTGLRFSKYWPLTGSTRFPPMKFW
jgi:hypothetical protein